MLEGKASDVEMAGFIVALRTKGETSSELATLVRTMLCFSTSVSVPLGAIDTCGTGGDRAGTFNVSTLAALVAAGAGARVVKHGNRAQSRRCGSADVLEALGIPIELEPDAVAALRGRSRCRLLLRGRSTTRRCAFSVRCGRRAECKPRSTSSDRSRTRHGSHGKWWV